MPIMMPTYTAPTKAIPTVKATWGISTVGKKILPQFSATVETFRTYQEPIFSPPCGLFLIVPALGFAFCKQEELDYLGERLGKNSDYAKAVFGNNATSTMRIAMVMIHTVLHLVTSVSSLTCQKSRKEMNKKSWLITKLWKQDRRKQRTNKKRPLTTIALATAGATNPGIEPMQFVRPRIVP